MGKLYRPRHASLQFWPRKRAEKELPRVNWKSFEKNNSNAKNHLLGFIGYKVGMISVLAKDNTANSMTKGKQVVLPATLVECPASKVLSIRFYKQGKVAGEILSTNLDKELKRKLKLPKQHREHEIKDFDDVRVLIYSNAKSTGIKKTPDIAEIGIKGNSPQEKLEFAKSLLNKELHFDDFFDKSQLIDVHAVTKAYGFEGPVKRFHIQLKPHKSEKGVRRPGSLGPWHPHRVTFRVPMAGQRGYFTRVQYNNRLLGTGKELAMEFQHYGPIKTNYVIIKGSVQGPAKRVLMLTTALRPTKSSAKENFELVRILK